MKAVEDFITKQYPDAEVEPGVVPNTYRVKYPVSSSETSVCLVIPTRDQLALTRQCISSILDKTTYETYEIIVVDNGSVEPETLAYFDEINKHEHVRVLDYDFPFNYSAINNFAVSHTDADIIGLINNDIEVISDGWLTEMVSHAVRPENGCVGAMLYYPNDTIQHAGVIMGVGGVANHSHKRFKRGEFGYYGRLTVVHNLSAVTAACLLVRKDVYEEVGGLNEDSLTVAFNDIDFCLKVREAGYLNVWTPFAELYHHESVSRGTEDSPEKLARFKGECDYMMTEWKEQIEVDPYYSPNLTLKKTDFSI